MPPSAIPSPIPSTPSPARAPSGGRSTASATRTSHADRATPAPPSSDQRSDRAENPSTFEDRLSDARRAAEPAQPAAESPSTDDGAEPAVAQPPATDHAPETQDTPPVDAEADPAEPADESEDANTDSIDPDAASEVVIDPRVARHATETPAAREPATNAPTRSKEPARVDRPPALPTEAKPSQPGAQADGAAPPQAVSTVVRIPSTPEEPGALTANATPQPKPGAPNDLRAPTTTPVAPTATSEVEGAPSLPSPSDAGAEIDPDRAARADRAVRDAERVFAPAARQGASAESPTQAPVDARRAPQPPAPAHPTPSAPSGLPADQPEPPAQTSSAASDASSQTNAAVGRPPGVSDERRQHPDGDDAGERRQPANREAPRVEAAPARDATGTQANQGNAAAHEVRTVGEPRASSSATAAQHGQPQQNDQAAAQAERAAVASANRGLEVALKQQGGSVRLRMNPETLGALKVEMTIARGVVSANLRASTAEAHELLSRNIDTLRAALEAKGLSVERLSITLAPASQGGSSGHASTNNGNSQPQHNSANPGATQNQNGEHDAGGERSRGFFERHERHRAAHRDTPEHGPGDATEERLFRYRFGLHAIG